MILLLTAYYTELKRLATYHLPSKNPSNKLKLFPPGATTYPWSDPADSPGLIPQVPWIPGVTGILC